MKANKGGNRKSASGRVVEEESTAKLRASAKARREFIQLKLGVPPYKEYRKEPLTQPDDVFKDDIIPNHKRRIALAFQGGAMAGGAFAAGAVEALVKHKCYQNRSAFEAFKIDTFSGTSSGALVAAVCWACVLNGEENELCGPKIDDAPKILRRQWLHFANGSIPTTGVARFLVNMETALRQFPPYDYIAQNVRVPLIGRVFQKWIEQAFENFEQITNYVSEVNRHNQQCEKPSDKIELPGLAMGATEMLSGDLTTFTEDTFDLESLLASGSLDDVNGVTQSTFRPNDLMATEDRLGQFLDGAWSQNPPIDELTEYQIDEIWLFQVFPKNVDTLPKSYLERADRREELWQNTLVEQELKLIKKTNTWLDNNLDFKRGVIKELDRGNFQLSRINNLDFKYRKIKTHIITMDRKYAMESGLVNSANFIREVMRNGHDETVKFLHSHRKNEAPDVTRAPKSWENGARHP